MNNSEPMILKMIRKLIIFAIYGLMINGFRRATIS